MHHLLVSSLTDYSWLTHIYDNWDKEWKTGYRGGAPKSASEHGYVHLVHHGELNERIMGGPVGSAAAAEFLAPRFEKPQKL